MPAIDAIEVLADQKEREENRMRRYVATFAMLASIIALATIQGIPLWLRIIIIAIGVWGTFDQLHEDYKNNHENIKICKTQSEIEDAMQELVRVQGKVCIMSRDLSWVNNRIKAAIIKKSESVRVFAQKESSLTNELKSSGVEVYYYGAYGFEPKTRFTIIRYNRNDRQVAIAETSNALKKKWFQHKIYETKNDTLPLIFLYTAICRW